MKQIDSGFERTEFLSKRMCTLDTDSLSYFDEDDDLILKSDKTVTQQASIRFRQPIKSYQFMEIDVYAINGSSLVEVIILNDLKSIDGFGTYARGQLPFNQGHVRTYRFPYIGEVEGILFTGLKNDFIGVVKSIRFYSLPEGWKLKYSAPEDSTLDLGLRYIDLLGFYSDYPMPYGEFSATQNPETLKWTLTLIQGPIAVAGTVDFSASDAIYNVIRFTVPQRGRTGTGGVTVADQLALLYPIKQSAYISENLTDWEVRTIPITVSYDTTTIGLPGVTYEIELLKVIRDTGSNAFGCLDHEDGDGTARDSGIATPTHVIRGPKGDKGDKGDKGTPGQMGAAGKDGIDGVDGIDGTDGVDGIDGEDGETTLGGLLPMVDLSDIPETPIHIGEHVFYRWLDDDITDDPFSIGAMTNPTWEDFDEPFDGYKIISIFEQGTNGSQEGGWKVTPPPNFVSASGLPLTVNPEFGSFTIWRSVYKKALDSYNGPVDIWITEQISGENGAFNTPPLVYLEQGETYKTTGEANDTSKSVKIVKGSVVVVKGDPNDDVPTVLEFIDEGADYFTVFNHYDSYLPLLNSLTSPAKIWNAAEEEVTVLPGNSAATFMRAGKAIAGEFADGDWDPNDFLMFPLGGGTGGSSGPATLPPIVYLDQGKVYGTDGSIDDVPGLKWPDGSQLVVRGAPGEIGNTTIKFVDGGTKYFSVWNQYPDMEFSGGYVTIQNEMTAGARVYAPNGGEVFEVPAQNSVFFVRAGQVVEGEFDPGVTWYENDYVMFTIDKPFDSSASLNFWEEGQRTSSPHNDVINSNWWKPTGTGEHLNVCLLPKGDGSLLTGVPNTYPYAFDTFGYGGGWKRGKSCIDLQIKRDGADKVASADYGGIFSGYDNKTKSFDANNKGEFSWIGGGFGNLIDGASHSCIGNGFQSWIKSNVGTDSALGSTIAGGYTNKIENAKYATIGGGHNNSIIGDGTTDSCRGSTIAGGEGGIIYAKHCFGAAGCFISSGSDGSVAIRGGINPNCPGSVVIVGGTIWGANCTIIGGSGNMIGSSASYSTIIGGQGNTIGGSHSVILGGIGLNISGDNIVGCENLVATGTIQAAGGFKAGGGLGDIGLTGSITYVKTVNFTAQTVTTGSLTFEGGIVVGFS